MFSNCIRVIAIILFALNYVRYAQADVFVIRPDSNSVCTAGQPCTVEWLDDGRAPLLSAFGLSTLGLYTGNQQLVQALPPVDVSATHSVNFVPIAGAGPNSGAYYISFISVSLTDGDGDPAMGFSPYFRLDQMTGSFDTPLAEATSTFPIPIVTSVPTTSGNGLTTPEGTISGSSESSPIPPSASASGSGSASISPPGTAAGSGQLPTSPSASAVNTGSTSSGFATSTSPTLTHASTDSSASPSASQADQPSGARTAATLSIVTLAPGYRGCSRRHGVVKAYRSQKYLYVSLLGFLVPDDLFLFLDNQQGSWVMTQRGGLS